MRPDELERPWERLDAVGPAPRAELLHVLMLPDFERADRIGGSGLPAGRAAVYGFFQAAVIANTHVWRRLDEPGMEVVHVESFSRATGTQIGRTMRRGGG